MLHFISTLISHSGRLMLEKTCQVKSECIFLIPDWQMLSIKRSAKVSHLLVVLSLLTRLTTTILPQQHFQSCVCEQQKRKQDLIFLVMKYTTESLLDTFGTDLSFMIYFAVIFLQYLTYPWLKIWMIQTNQAWMCYRRTTKGAFRLFIAPLHNAVPAKYMTTRCGCWMLAAA